MADISERLRKEAFEAVDWNGETMKQWDKIRALCAERDGSDLPRLMFEGLIENLAELMVEGANEIDSLRGRLRKGSMAAQWTYDAEADAYYFAPLQAAKPPYLIQRHVDAILDIASDGTLAGVELIDNVPPPPTAALTYALSSNKGETA